MKGKDEREAAWASWSDENQFCTDGHELAFKVGWNLGNAARPEPPEPDGDLTSSDAWKKWFGLLGAIADADVVNATANLVLTERELFAQQHAARADAPADVCECGHLDNRHSRADQGPDGQIVYSGDCYPEDGSDCPCTQFTPAPTSPERRAEVSGEQINALRHAAVDAERDRIAAELREILRNKSSYALSQYIDKLEGK